jgi:hypothetical protein
VPFDDATYDSGCRRQFLMNSGKRKYGRTFPLHLAPIDWYFLSDDSPDHPMVFYLELEFSGRIDRAKFNAALEEALERHPLMYSVVRLEKKNKLCWVPDSDQMAQIDWADAGAPIELPDGEYIDMRKTPGLRMWARQSDEKTELTLQIHHAVTDGTGLYRFIGDLVACYMMRLHCCAGQVKLGSFDVVQLKIRRTKMRSFRAEDSAIRKLTNALSEARKQFTTRVAPLQLPATKPNRIVYPGIVNQEFSKEQLAALRAAATSRGATLNDLFLCKMFQTAKQWNQATATRRKLRLLVPSDMRDGDDFEMPACNMTAYTFIGLKPSEIDDEEALLDRIREETRQIKNGNRQRSFLNALTTAMNLPFVLEHMLQRNVCLATSVFSNAGDPSRRFTCQLPKRRGKVSCDEFTLESITGVPPLRRMTHCTMSSSIYGRKLTFSMRCTPQHFSQQESAKLLNLYCEQLRPIADQVGSR